MSDGRKSGKLSMILIWGAIIVVGVIFYKKMQEPSETEKMLGTPESALHTYLQAAYDHCHAANNQYLEQIQKCVPDSDWQWFLGSQDSLFQDSFDLAGATDPNEMAANKKFIVMKTILSAGIDRPDAAIIGSPQINNSTAVFTMEKVYSPEYKTQMPVSLVKEGKVWKVKDFAGGKTAVTSQGGPVAGI